MSAMLKRSPKKPAKVTCSVEVGRAYAFSAPVHPFHGIYSKVRNLRVVVVGVRDLVQDPIEHVLFDVQPLLRRSRFAFLGVNMVTGESDVFYTDNLRNLREISSRDDTDRREVPIWFVNGFPFTDIAAARAVAESVRSGQSSAPVEIKVGYFILTEAKVVETICNRTPDVEIALNSVGSI